MDDLKNSRSSVADQDHNEAAQVNLALSDNPILREYTDRQLVASAGPRLYWEIYSATKNSTKEEVAVSIFDKKQMEKWREEQREEYLEVLKRGVSQLTGLEHPSILTVKSALEESNDSLAFCTEPVFTVLANLFDYFDYMRSTRKCYKDFNSESNEIRDGLIQLSKALVFLHHDKKMVHSNISPNSVIINKKGVWKLAGFDFCTVGDVSSQDKVIFGIPNWSRNSIWDLRPDLNFVSTELVQGDTFDYSSDIFSLGMLAITCYNRGRSSMESINSFAWHRRMAERQKSLSCSSILPPSITSQNSQFSQYRKKRFYFWLHPSDRRDNSVHLSDDNFFANGISKSGSEREESLHPVPNLANLGTENNEYVHHSNQSPTIMQQNFKIDSTNFISSFPSALVYSKNDLQDELKKEKSEKLRLQDELNKEKSEKLQYKQLLDEKEIELTNERQGFKKIEEHLHKWINELLREVDKLKQKDVLNVSQKDNKTSDNCASISFKKQKQQQRYFTF
uniref:Protein kinase domain-containing protein n=1 Tax=Meloidogyne enterolobii TaxID=390850 RepID=A0A6V7US15_MELEN|nr:unnamed protein product [Meloidogyne enterolobii]